MIAFTLRKVIIMAYKDFNDFATKYSIKAESGKGYTSNKVTDVRMPSLESYKLYSSRPYDIRIIENLDEFSIYTDSDEHNDVIIETINLLRTLPEWKHIHAIKCYLIGLNNRGINVSLMTSGNLFFVNEPFEVKDEIYRSTNLENKLTKEYRYRSMESFVYEAIADNQGQMTELRIGDFGALYCLRKFYKKFFPERVSTMYVAGKIVDIYDVHDFGLPKVSSYTAHRRPRVSSAFRELLDESFDYDFLDRMEESAKNFDLNGTKLDGHFFYDYRGRMYWSGNINPQGAQENRHLSINGKGIVEYDATCSGIQIGSMLSGNVEMMKKCNVISVGTNEKQDAYKYIADKACEDMGLEVGTISRNIAKKPVMLLPYGAAAMTMINHAIVAAEEEGHEDPREIGKGVYRAVDKYIDRESTYRKILDLIEVKVFSKDGVDYGQYCSWTTPDGLNVNSYSKLPAIKINQMLAEGADLLHTYSKITLNLELDEKYHIEIQYLEGCNIKFFKNDTPNIGQLVPNFIHSLDATALRYVCNKLLDAGYDVFPIHDCVIVSEEHSHEYISSLFREAYQMIADHYGADVTVDGMVVFPE